MYHIELVAVGADLYSLLEASASRLNAVQDEFRFEVVPERQRQEGINLVRRSYKTTDVFTFLEEFRTRYGGNRRHLIAFIPQHLDGVKLGNLFGSSRADRGLAVVTIHGSEQYVRETVRYCCYFMTRYAMGFVSPTMKSHEDPARSSCYFNMKRYKREIRDSMDSGQLCNECSSLLQAANPSVEEVSALAAMRKWVSGQYPLAMVMKGGGVKGLAFASALKELARFYWFDMHVGTSAGAIAATLLAAGYTPTELEEKLKEKKFADFMDAGWIRRFWNLATSGGMFPGKHFEDWMEKLILAKFPDLAGRVRMHDLNHALLFASQSGSGSIVFDSMGERNDACASYAARCSMSIPLFFIAPQLDGLPVLDGGLRNNFPLAKFKELYAPKPFVALYLKPRPGRKGLPSQLLDIIVEGDEREFVDHNSTDVVQIDPSPIRTTDFGLSDLEKEFLLAVGRSSAISFLRRRNLDNGPAPEEESDANFATKVLHDKVVKRRLWRGLLRWALAVAALLALGAVCHWWFS